MAILVLWATQDLCAKKKPPLRPVNVNSASSAELQLVPGIGPVTAEKILQARKSYGAFKSVDDLQAIKGIGPKRLEKMRKYLTVGTPKENKQTSPQAAGAPKTPLAKNPPAEPSPTPKEGQTPASEEEEP